MIVYMPEILKAKIHITGIVQGVGFRPFIYGLASRHTLKGWVRNTSAGVDIEVDGARETLEEFANAIRSELPPLARLDSFELVFEPAGNFQGFEIVESLAREGAFQPISPDVCVCPDCLTELYDPADRRHLYPFINCTNCGPRFTIIKDLPYDRPKTTMAEFVMCPECAAEYHDPRDRRFHAQPVACPVCGPHIWLESGAGAESVRDADALRSARDLLLAGRILAVKGLGGFHLACDATNPEAVTELRRRKLRVDKPFAVMMLDLETVQRYCVLGPAEQSLLESRQRPIVLLERKPGTDLALEVAPLQKTVGVMLPYTPLHFLLFRESLPGEPLLPALVMTSGNLSEEPIATGNEEALERLSSLADAFLLHDRDIHIRCDDSVLRVVDGKSYPLRRSRGYAPDPIQVPRPMPPLLAVGPQLKNTFCLTRDKYAFLSHHIGDLENYETLQSFEQGIEHFERLFHIRPEAIAHDLHPDYLSTRYAGERAGREGLALIGVQHHHAHIAACMADQGLDGSRPVIGLSFDGTGYGEDGAIWGGEFLVADYHSYERCYHLAYFPLPGGDASIRRPARSALALLWSLGLEWEDWLAPVQDLCLEEKQALWIQLEGGLNTPPTSSLGRLFDAVAALAGVRQSVNYEAQAAIEFENCLSPDETGSYPFELGDGVVGLDGMLKALLADLAVGIATGILSARFHNGLADLASRTCREIRARTGLNEVALSGGVWQNRSLLEKTVPILRAEGFNVLIHHRVPANDGGVSLGQALVAAAGLHN
jgi:hydrogenase maturation protein HypF